MKENTPNHGRCFKSKKKGQLCLLYTPLQCLNFVCFIFAIKNTHIFTYTNQQRGPPTYPGYLQLSETRILKSFQDPAERNGKTGRATQNCEGSAQWRMK